MFIEITTGALKITCEIERLLRDAEERKQRDRSIEEKTHDTFLTLADRITSSMVSQGDEATHILNAVERLQGIIFHQVDKGSIIIQVCFTLIFSSLCSGVLCSSALCCGVLWCAVLWCAVLWCAALWWAEVGSGGLCSGVVLCNKPIYRIGFAKKLHYRF